jgi:hypothetical protein
MSESTPNTYAIRRVNPFLGVLQVLECEAGRAISSNGVTWDIQVVTDGRNEWDYLSSIQSETAYYRYGLWSREEGLVQRPLAALATSVPLSEQCNIILRYLEQAIDVIPFNLADNQELWLFDAELHQPLALLATTRPGEKLPIPEPRYWQACFGAQGVPGQRRFPQTREIEELVKQCAGFNMDKRWLTRNADGTGKLHRTGETLAEAMFPPLLIRQHWNDQSASKLVSEYLDWTAPALLTLQNLSSQLRSQLEQALAVQALSVEYHWRLYPEVIKQDRITAARVQSRMQKAAT